MSFSLAISSADSLPLSEMTRRDWWGAAAASASVISGMAPGSGVACRTAAGTMGWIATSCMRLIVWRASAADSEGTSRRR